MHRRRLLTGLGAVGTAGLAGCLDVLGADSTSDSAGFELVSDRIYRERPVRTETGLVLTFTYAVGDTAYRFDAGDGDEEMLFPNNGWFLKTTVNWVWEGAIPEGWELDPAAFRLVVGGEYFEVLSGLPRGIEWDAIEGQPAAIQPHFTPGGRPDWSSRQGLVNFLFDAPADPDRPYYLEWDPSAPVDGSSDPVFLTSTYGPFERGASPGTTTGSS